MTWNEDHPLERVGDYTDISAVLGHREVCSHLSGNGGSLLVTDRPRHGKYVQYADVIGATP